jgi:Flp pilus assembly protein TadG
MRSRRDSERGNSIVEFMLVGVPVLFLVISIAQMSLAMWSFHTLAFAVREGVRYASTKGPGCSITGNACATTVGSVAQKVAVAGVGLQTSQLNLTLTSSAGSVTCTPLSSCVSDTTRWPPSSAAVQSNISITGSYPIVTFLPFANNLLTNSGTVSASSQQALLF